MKHNTKNVIKNILATWLVVFLILVAGTGVGYLFIWLPWLGPSLAVIGIFILLILISKQIADKFYPFQ